MFSSSIRKAMSAKGRGHRKFMRFRTKTILGVAAIEMVLLAILVSSALAVLQDSNESALVDRVQLGGKLLAAAAKDAVIAQDLATLDSLASEAMSSGLINYVRILDDKGLTLTEQGKAGDLSQPFRQDVDIAHVTDGIFDWSVPVLAGGIKYGEVRLGASTGPLHELLASTRDWVAGVAVLEMTLVALFSWLLGSYLVRELVAFRTASRQFASGNFDYRVPVRGSDELAETARAFNLMASELGENHALLREENRMRVKAQHDAELARAQAEDRTEQLSVIFSLSPDGFVSFDAERRVKYANDAFLHMTGFSRDEIAGLDEDAFSELLGRKCLEEVGFIGVASMREGLNPIDQDDFQGRENLSQLIKLAIPAKRTLDVRIRISDGVSISQILYFRDVTHETEVDRMKSEFLSHAAHELRTPMSSIYGFSELLIANEFDAETRKDLIMTIHQQAAWLVEIINELLDLARIEERRGQDFKMEEVEFAPLLREVVRGIKIDLGRWPLEVECTEDLPHVRGDEAKLRQALTNVLANAVKYSPSGGAIGLRCFQEKIGDRSYIGISIKDHGIGMTSEQSARVGERFFRADTSGSIPGSGLGMAIVKEIVGLHGGHIEISSMLGRGTNVTIWLPTKS